jgi:hypothetical protein
MNQNLIDGVRQTVINNNLASHSSKNKTFTYLPNGLPEWYEVAMTKLGDKYRNIRWLPLDIPEIKFDNYNEFLEVWDRESIDVVRTKPCTAEPWEKDKHPLGKLSNWHVPQFKGLHFYTEDPDKFYETERGIFAHRYYSHPVFDPIIKQVKDYFPFHHIFHMYIWESVKEVYPHRDQTFFWNCPTEFRAMLHDENDKPTLYVSDVEHGDSHFVDTMGLDTNSFCWSNGSQIHGSDYLGKRKQILCINGFLSVSKLDNLLERSVNKYKDQLNYKLEL